MRSRQLEKKKLFALRVNRNIDVRSFFNELLNSRRQTGEMEIFDFESTRTLFLVNNTCQLVFLTSFCPHYPTYVLLVGFHFKSSEIRGSINNQ